MDFQEEKEKMKLYKLFNRKVFHIEPSIERIRGALKEIENPQKQFKSILIGGTNGKGSTAAFLETLLREHNLKTGLFISPHLVEENERWQINRENISDEDLEKYIEKIKPLIEKYNLTYFEASTLLAFKYFSDKNVDVAVLEVGLGGRWDATNVVEPEVSIITNVSLDHTHMLGDTVDKIASEKIGIARKDKPLVIGTEQMEIISKAILKGVKEIYHYPIGFSYKKKDKNRFDFFFKGKKIENLEISMLGDRQIHNASTALAGFFIFSEKEKIHVKEEKIRKALKDTFWPGRMQILGKNPSVVLDGAHNEEAIVETVKEIEKLFPNKEIVFVYSGMKDKNWKKIVNLLRHKGDVIFTKIPVSRGLDREDFKEFDFPFEENVKTAVEMAKIKALKENKIVVILGSLYLAGEVLKSIKKEG